MLIPQRARLRRWYRGILKPGEATPLQILVIQSTTFCNIDCSYCYLPLRERKGRFDLSRLPLLLSKLRDCGLLGPQLTLVWHAGEPLVLPAAYYEEAFSLVKSAVGDTSNITHSFQTNAMLVSDEHCALFRKWQARVGVSIDGPAHVHDRCRKTRTGGGSHAAAMAGIAKLRAQGIPFGTISVVTEGSLPHADEIFHFLRGLGSSDMGFNVDELEGENRTTSLAGSGSKARYAAFMRRLLELSTQTPGAPPVREFRHALSSLQGAVFGQKVSSMESNPLSILSVGIDGRLATYSPELLDARHPVHGPLAFGTIEDVEFETIFEQPAFAAVHAEVQAGLARCESGCSYFDVCGGAAPSNKLAEHGTFDAAETMFCDLRYKAVIDIGQQFLEDRLAAMRQARTPPSGA